MLKLSLKLSLSLLIAVLSLPGYANDQENCAVELAVASPPVLEHEYVAFNITSDVGVSRSATLSKGSAPRMMDKLPCSEMPYKISATHYSHQINELTTGTIGQCYLKAGAIVLSKPNSSVSVVFPQDFVC